ncbi:unnamed protein product, partial [Staurois parvus]
MGSAVQRIRQRMVRITSRFSNSRQHHGTEDQAEGWSGKPGVKQETVSRVRNNAESATNQIGRGTGTQDTRYRGSWETYTKAL